LPNFRRDCQNFGSNQADNRYKIILRSGVQSFAQLKPFKDKDKIKSAQTYANTCAVKHKPVDNGIVNGRINRV
jgi:hypothetical protein